MGAVRVGLIDGEVIVQPTRRELSKSSLNLIVTAADQKLIGVCVCVWLFNDSLERENEKDSKKERERPSPLTPHPTVMLEGGGNNVLQQDFMKAIKVGVKECQQVVKAIQQLAKAAGKPKRSFTNVLSVPEEVLQAVR